jgi:hypothetical protein
MIGFGHYSMGILYPEMYCISESLTHGLQIYLEGGDVYGVYGG